MSVLEHRVGLYYFHALEEFWRNESFFVSVGKHNAIGRQIEFEPRGHRFWDIDIYQNLGVGSHACKRGLSQATRFEIPPGRARETSLLTTFHT
jgi:hypothetical protein